MDQLLRVDVAKSLGSDTLKLRKTEPSEENKKRILGFIKNPKASKGKTIPYTNKDFTGLAEKSAKGLFVDPSLDDDLMAGNTNFNEQLGEITPSNESVDVFGVDIRDPSSFEKSKFIRQMRVIEDPTHVLDLMDRGMLSPLEVETLTAFYPLYYEKLTADVLEAVAESQGVEVSPQAKRSLSMLLGVPRITPGMLANDEEEEETKSGADLNVDTGKSATQEVSSRRQ